MIGWLRGVVIAKQPPSLLLDVSGVGYEVEAPMSTFSDLPAMGESTTLFIHHVVREDAQLLYGFARVSDRDTFRALLKVNGVGGKVALAILSSMDGETLAQAVNGGDVAALTRVPGIGKKTAERLVVEMRDRLEGITSPASAFPAGTPPRPADPVAEAVSALIALGLKPQEASRRVAAIDDPDLASEELVRRALRAMA